MKVLVKQILVFSLICTVMLSNHMFSSEANTSENIIYTRITDVFLPPKLSYRVNYPNWTFFEFEGTCEIINPSGRILYILTSHMNLVFITGNLSFENEQYFGNLWGPSALMDMFENHTINPGISEEFIVFTLSVNDTLVSLPNGNFTARIYIDDCIGKHNYHHFPSIISVNDSDIHMNHTGAYTTFTFPEEPSQTTILSYYFLVTLPLCLIVIVLTKKKINSQK
ncbi:MAG: hypothetical protein KAU62_01560 [Candidatus Heimdallarchaeota archaeon]|nr:hypothetical protein [Candidatus Heimdallarchaeota archaeon]MCG3254740.1 hypothetical protein [Candidatus Heimdallarchaeota archaeon]MCK4609819.1 hypothetical protein [Candidatus Heimdallarchaeota archaeon]